MKNLDRYYYNGAWASLAPNKTDMSNEELLNGLLYGSPVISTNINDFIYKITKHAQYDQFTGGLYSPDIDYDEGNLCTLLVHWYVTLSGPTVPILVDKYELLAFRRNGNRKDIVKNNPPILNATLENFNGIISYKSLNGLSDVNSDWDMGNSVLLQLIYKTALTTHEEDTAAHSSTELATPLRIVRRDANGMAEIENSPVGVIPSKQIINAGTAKQMAETNGNVYTYVIDSDEKLATLIESSQDGDMRGNDYSKILIKSSTVPYTYDRGVIDRAISQYVFIDTNKTQTYFIKNENVNGIKLSFSMDNAETQKVTCFSGVTRDAYSFNVRYEYINIELDFYINISSNTNYKTINIFYNTGGLFRSVAKITNKAVGNGLLLLSGYNNCSNSMFTVADISFKTAGIGSPQTVIAYNSCDNMSNAIIENINVEQTLGYNFNCIGYMSCTNTISPIIRSIYLLLSGTRAGKASIVCVQSCNILCNLIVGSAIADSPNGTESCVTISGSNVVSSILVYQQECTKAGQSNASCWNTNGITGFAYLEGIGTMTESGNTNVTQGNGIYKIVLS